ncbi:MAG: hypothetical protein ACLP3B_05970 [Syntrophobacteraceae bacterium]
MSARTQVRADAIIDGSSLATIQAGGDLIGSQGSTVVGLCDQQSGYW